MNPPSGINWVESAKGHKWIGYIPGCVKGLYLALVKMPDGGWQVSFGERVLIRRFGTEYVAKMSAIGLAIDCLTESLVNLQQEREYGPSR